MRPPFETQPCETGAAGAPSAAALSSLLGAMPRGRLSDNVVYFIRMLRAAGLPVGPAKVLDALAAVEAVGIDNRDDFREALAAVVVSKREHLVLFEQAFDLFWRNPRLLEKMLAAMLPKVQGRGGVADELPARLAQAMLPPPPPRGESVEDESDLDAAFSFSALSHCPHSSLGSRPVGAASGCPRRG